MLQREKFKRTLVWALSYVKNKRVSWDAFTAFTMYRAEIASRLSADIYLSAAENIHGAVTQSRTIKPDVLFVCSQWDVGWEEIKSLIEALREVGAVKKIVFVDTCDATCTPNLPLLANVDIYIKPCLFRDTHMYLRKYLGGYIFTDFLVNQLGWTINDWHFGSCADEQYLGKLRVGWNYGVSRRYRLLANLSSLLPIPWVFRRTEINRRFSPVKRDVEEWYEQYRKMASKSIDQLEIQRKISGYERINYNRYILEMMASKIVLSPFGWGEVCIRDYETVACGALLIKPDMSHARTEPDIFRANETYVPIKWDFSDLAEKVDYYLSHPKEAKRIAFAGRRCLLDYFRQKKFLTDFNGYLDVQNYAGI